MLLRDVNLRARARNEIAQRQNEKCDNENETRHTPAKLPLPPLLQQHALCLSRVYGSTGVAQK